MTLSFKHYSLKFLNKILEEGPQDSLIGHRSPSVYPHVYLTWCMQLFYQAFHSIFCIIQAIKSWRWERPGNEATPASRNMSHSRSPKRRGSNSRYQSPYSQRQSTRRRTLSSSPPPESSQSHMVQNTTVAADVHPGHDLPSQTGEAGTAYTAGLYRNFMM